MRSAHTGPPFPVEHALVINMNAAFVIVTVCARAVGAALVVALRNGFHIVPCTIKIIDVDGAWWPHLFKSLL